MLYIKVIHIDYRHCVWLDIGFEKSKFYYDIGNFYNSTSFNSSYDFFNEKMNDIINEWWKKTFNFNINDEFIRIKESLLVQKKEIEDKFNSCSSLLSLLDDEKFLIYRKILLAQKKEIEDIFNSCSLLSSLDDESKGLNLKK